MKLVIVESPYAGEISKNVDYARRAVKHSLSLGEAPIASHLLYTQKGILDDNIADQRALGMQAGLAWRYKADLAVFYTDRGWSAGMLAARDLYQSHDIPFVERSIEASFTPSDDQEETIPVVIKLVEGAVLPSYLKAKSIRQSTTVIADLKLSELGLAATDTSVASVSIAKSTTTAR